MTPTRRTFLKAAAAAPMLFAPAVHGGQAGRKFRTALIGCGWWGKNILVEALAAGRTTVVGLCDVDTNALEATADEVADKSGDAAKKYKDYRELIEKEKPEVVIVATPDHWHALPTIAAIKAGAHVFVEKPTGHTVNESRALLAAARAAGTTVQVGLHRRIGPHHVSGMKFLRSGAVGKIGQVRMFVSGRGGVETASPNLEPPKGMDWDMYCGPAPLRPFNRKIHPGGFRNFLDFANGTFGDWGAHWVDQVLWWTEEKYPKRVFSAGGRPVSGPIVFSDKAQTTDTPDEQVAVFEFESFTATWEHRKFADNHAEKHKIGAYFYGTNGTFHMGWRDGWTFYPADDRKPTVHGKAVHHHEKDGHNVNLLWADFVEAIDAKRKPVADIEPSHRSTVTTLLGMLSYKAGRSIRWDGSREQIIDDPQANEMLARKYRGPWEYPAV
jgi:predicted dehydrogenase